MAVNSLFQSTRLQKRNAYSVKLHTSSVTMLLQFLNNLRLNANSIIVKSILKARLFFLFFHFY